MSRSEPAPELEKKLKLMALDKLQTERIMAKLYSVSGEAWVEPNAVSSSHEFEMSVRKRYL